MTGRGWILERLPKLAIATATLGIGLFPTFGNSRAAIQESTALTVIAARTGLQKKLLLSPGRRVIPRSDARPVTQAMQPPMTRHARMPATGWENLITRASLRCVARATQSSWHNSSRASMRLRKRTYRDRTALPATACTP